MTLFYKQQVVVIHELSGHNTDFKPAVHLQRVPQNQCRFTRYAEKK